MKNNNIRNKKKKEIGYDAILSAPLSNINNPLTTLSLFTGVGGLDYGAKKSNFASLFRSDIMKAAGEIFSLNINNKRKHLKSEGVFAVGKNFGDIHNLSFESISNHVYSKLKLKIRKGEIAVICGGPPCQDISRANPLRSVLSKRNRLIFELIRLIKEFRPKVGLIEQVPDLLSLKYRRLWTEIKVTLDNLRDYVWDYKIMDAAEYGGRQRRKRLIIMIVRKDLGVPVSFPEPTQKHIERVYVNKLLPHVYAFSPGQFGDDIHDAKQNVFCTMTATGCEKAYGLDGKARGFTMPERLVLTELEGLNTGKIPITWQKKLVGNMVQVSLAEALFRHIRDVILKHRQRQNRTKIAA